MLQRARGIVIFSCFSLSAFGHSGGLDKNGGHRDSRTGSYHYHRSVPTPPPPPVVTVVRPSIASQPQSRTIRIGDTLSLSVAATGTPPLTYRWEKDGNIIAGATSSVYAVQSAGPATAGQYRCVITNRSGSVATSVATVAVTPQVITTPPPPVVVPTPPVAAPRITSQPQTAALARGSGTVLSVKATGIDVRYQWYIDEVPILGASSPSYRIQNAQEWMAGTYQVVMTNAGGTTKSQGAFVNVGTAHLREEFTSPLSTAIWTSAQPFSDSRVEVAAGSLILRNRGRLLVRSAVPQSNVISARFRLSGSNYDQFAIFLRTDGATQNGSFNSGVSILFQVRAGDQGAVGSNNIKISQASGDVTASYPLSTNTWYDVTVDDDGNSIAVFLNGTAVVFAETTTRAGNLVGLQNREGAVAGSSISAGSVAEVDFFTIASREDAGAHQINASRLANISTRGYVGFRGEPMVVGFVTTGTKAHRLLLRAAGPALGSFGVPNPLRDPALTVFDSSRSVINMNEDWSAGTASSPDIAASVGAFPLAVGSLDSALVATFASGAYTARVDGRGDNAMGVAVIEGYDLDVNETKVRLKNIAARGFVGVNGENLSAGLVVSGEAPRKILIRAIGPSLTGFGVADALSDPVLSVYDSSRRLILHNDNWSNAENSAHIAAAAEQSGAFEIARDSKDSSILAYAPPGAYTFVITSKTEEIGVALIEAYDLD